MVTFTEKKSKVTFTEKPTVTFSEAEDKDFGIRRNPDKDQDAEPFLGFDFDFGKDIKGDILDLTKEPYQSNRFKNVYWFGYKFNKDIDHNEKKEFIKILKNCDERDFYTEERRRFIQKPLALLEDSARIRDVDCTIYPKSNRSGINNYQVKQVGRYFNDKNRVSIELIKEESKKVKFDKKKFFEDHASDYKNETFRKQAEESFDKMVDKIHKLEYFSISELPFKFRHYVSNYLKFTNPEVDLNPYHKAIVIDDIVTSGSTLEQIIIMCKNLNPNLELYIYAIIDSDAELNEGLKIRK